MKRANLLKKLFIAAILCVTGTAQADVTDDLNDFFNKLGGGANFSDSGIIKGQGAGYMVGGSFFMRTPVRNIQLISITLPSINAGCGGIDAYLGAFSYINSAQLKAYGKQILSNAVGYAFDLALEVTCPQCRSVMNFLQSLANDVNSLNISTCHAAQGIVGGILPSTDATRQYVCNSIAGQNNIFADFARSRQGCGPEGEATNILNQAKPNQAEQVPQNKNIVWESFKKINESISNDRELKELMMSVVGTIIYDPNGNISILPTLGANDQFIHTLLYGGKTPIYRCDETERCLRPIKSEVTIDEKKALVHHVSKTLSGIFEKVKTNRSLEPKEKELITLTHVPIQAYARNLAMLNQDESGITKLAEYVSLDFALGYIDELVRVTEFAAQGSMNSEKETDRYKENLRTVREKLSYSLVKVQARQDAFLAAWQQQAIFMKELSNETTQKIGFGQ